MASQDSKSQSDTKTQQDTGTQQDSKYAKFPSLEKMVPLIGIIDYLGKAKDLLRTVIMILACEDECTLFMGQSVFRNPNIIPPANLDDGLVLLEKLLPAVEEFCRRKPDSASYLINAICGFCKLSEKPNKNQLAKFMEITPKLLNIYK